MPAGVQLGVTVNAGRHRLCGLRHFIGGLLALTSLSHARRVLVSALLQHLSANSLITARAKPESQAHLGWQGVPKRTWHRTNVDWPLSGRNAAHRHAVEHRTTFMATHSH